MAGRDFTETQLKILKVLSDGRSHTKAELQACVPDELASISALQVHISRLRKKLQPAGEDILCVFVARSFQYRHVRLLSQEA